MRGGSGRGVTGVWDRVSVKLSSELTLLELVHWTGVLPIEAAAAAGKQWR